MADEFKLLLLKLKLRRLKEKQKQIETEIKNTEEQIIKEKQK